VKRLYKIFIIFILSAVISHLSSDVMAQWTQQSIPVSGGTINDMQFINAQTGWICKYDSGYVMKTTNAGNNWFIASRNIKIYELYFFNDTLGYSLADISGNSTMFRTINGGINWSQRYSTGEALVNMSFPNPDTGWICGLGDLGKIWRTTNAGQTFTEQLSSGSTSMDRIFFLKDRVNGEYTGWCSQAHILRKTTNSGLNWFVQTAFPTSGLSSLFFLNKNIGWISYYPNLGSQPLIAKTTDGGDNWFTQYKDSISSITAVDIFFIDSLKGWSGRGFNKIFATTNGGTNWGTQSIPIFSAFHLSFPDSLNGWVAYSGLAHTTNGGGPITYTGININNTTVPVNFTLQQNYPNPFNPSTNITFSLKANSFVSLGIFDITGKEILKIYNNDKLTIGNYISRLDFGKMNISSGVYFYKLEVSGINNNKLFSQTKKMIYSK
jgi:photosystem II stability/assembly factor-like uncharacterized protein